MNQADNARIFISYSHRGNGPAWKAALLRALHVFERYHLLDVWEDGRIRVSSYWEDDIERAMGEAQLAVILLTKEALESEFILTKELPRLRDRQQRDKLCVFPIICEPCDWRAHDWLRATQAPNASNPLSELKPAAQDNIFRQLAADIAEELSRIALAALPVATGLPPDESIYLDRFPLTRSSSLREDKLIGRGQELALLDLCFAQPHTAIVSLVAWGGVGKTILVQHWLQRLQREGWFGARRVYAWSFYSQGTKEDRQASEDTFLSHALERFGVQCESTLAPWIKGRLLADAVARERTLLILDGIEPLQYPPGPMGGQLRAPGVQSMLKQLARKANNTEHRGLCLVTTREPLADLADFERSTDAAWGSVLRVDLGNLSAEAGAALLHHAGAKRAGAAAIKTDDIELLAASREVDSHALTLNLLGRFLHHAHGGDIRRRDMVKFEEADRKEQGGTAFRMLAAFEIWFDRGSAIYKQQLAVLRMLGLFDRPADDSCIGVLRQPPPIVGLTDSLFTTRLDDSSSRATAEPLLQEDWNTATSFLADFGLVVIQADTDNGERLLDCHPLIREHFAKQLSHNNYDSWCSAHKRLYAYLKETAEYQPDTLEGLQPLYHAVAHGCQAKLFQETCDDVFFARIARGNESYALTRLGAVGDDLSAVAAFFKKQWSEPASELTDADKAWLFSEAAVRLHSSGRLLEAIDPLRSGLNIRKEQKAWPNAARIAGNLSDLEMALGDVANAIRDAECAVAFAKQGGEVFQRICLASALGDSFHQAGRRSEAMTSYREAENLQAAYFPDYPLLNAIRGSRYCELLLSQAERRAWWAFLVTADMANASGPGSFHRGHAHYLQALASFGEDLSELLDKCMSVHARISKTQQQMIGQSALIDTASENFVMCLAALFYGSLSRLDSKYGKATQAAFSNAKKSIEVACDIMFRSGRELPRGLLTRAWLRFLECDAYGARADLDEAWDIAERGPMRLHQADIYLHRSRLFFREKPYPWKSPQDDLAAARRLIEQCGYWRRKEELEDAEEAFNAR